MARRKQRNPQHLESPQNLATALRNGIQSDSDSAAEDDEHVCGKCRAEFPTLGDFLQHKKGCSCKRPVLLPPCDEDEEEEDEDDRRHSANAAAAARVLLLSSESGMRQDTNVALAQLKNTTVAVAQRGIYFGKQAALKEFFVKFQQKQIESLQLIQTIEDIILKSGGGAVPPPLIGTAALTPPESAEGALNGANACTPARVMHVYAEHCGKTDLRCAPTGAACPQPGSPPPEASSLQLLERHAERCLRDSAPRRTLLLDEELKPGERGHRCHFCGKVLGSDSALQIHLRSHTGEKPFRCNVCGSSFSTRGNLKVHSQRHRDAVESPKPEQALDFSTSMNGDANSRSSMSPTNTSNCSDNSADNSVDAVDNYSELKIDVERFDEEDDDDQASSNDLDDEDDERASSEPIFDTSPTFAPYFLPPSFPDGSMSLAPMKAISMSSAPAPMNNGTTNGDDSAVPPDPTIYQDLLPRIGSNDNSWESLIEVTRTSETSKLQQLVDNIEHKLTDPNQCIICHRVLSCKSALQMHYRTHTGERPFKCKLCRRAFTTKGNLKTHMGVHRVKPPARVLHQCPVCHKQFANSVILQQHIRNHTGDGTLVPQLLSNDNKPPTLLPPSYPRQFLIPPHLMKPEPLALTSSKPPELTKSPSDCESVIRTTSLESVNKPASLSPVTNCSPAHRNDESPATVDQRPPVLDLAFPQNSSPREKSENTSFDDSKVSERSLSPEKNIVNGVSNVSDTEHEETIARRSSSPKLENSQSVINKTHNTTSSGYSIPTVSKSQSNRLTYTNQSVNLPLISLASDRPLPMTLPSDCPIPFNVHGVDRPYPPMSMPSCTTEYTASLAALENHVKAINSSATHSLPFPPHFGLGINMANYYRDFAQPYQKSSGSSPSASKNGSDASADDRSTPGGMIKRDSPKSSTTHKSESGALDLTPRSSPAFQRSVTDLKMFTPLTGLPFPPPNHRMNNTTCKVCYKTFACHSALEIHYRSHTKERPFRCEVCDRGFSTKGNMRQHMMTHKIRDLPEPMYSSSTPQRTSVSSSVSSVSSSISSSTPATAETSGEQRLPKKESHESSKRPATDSVLPPTQPKRSPGHSKHLCQVCNKPFSSGSALQIHMRTHTGDKPFQCHICHRAFTTKGNLKVHMGTHMYNNSTSRRGRRMSLDLSPLQLQHAASKPMDFSQARPDLFYPYLPAYVNGLTQSAQHNSLPPKMNEISVIQTAGVNNSVVCTSTATSLQPISLVTSNNSSSQNQGIPQDKDHPSLLPQVGELGSWPWKISCNICNKICSSSTDLELHIRNNHCKKESQETSTQSPREDTSA